MVDFCWNPMEITIFYPRISLSLKHHPLPWNHHKSSKKTLPSPMFFLYIKMEKKRKRPLIWDDFSHLQKSPENPPKITSRTPIFSASLADFLRDLRVDLRRPRLAVRKHVPIAVGKFQDLRVHLAERSSGDNKRRKMMCLMVFNGVFLGFNDVLVLF